MSFPISSSSSASIVLPHEPSAWLGHVPFALWLVEAVRPRVLVELGTHHGHSYFTFCEGVGLSRLDTKCFGVDSWRGDRHAGEYDESVFDAASRHNETYFSGFSRLLRMTFDEALGYFSDNSIDLLHIDGLHTYEAVRHDFDSWLPKLSDAAVVLLHDVNVRERDFGVWHLWEELRQRYPHVEFKHSHGLGVLLVGPRQPAALVRLVEQWSDEQARVVIASLYARLGRVYELESQLGDVRIKVQELAAAVQASDARAKGLEAALEEAAAHRARVLQEAEAERTRVLAELEARSRLRVAGVEEERDMLQVRLDQVEAHRQALLQSASWRMTTPYRWSADQVRQLRDLRALLPAAARLSGGLPQLLRRSVQVLRDEGVTGLKRRVRYLASRGAEFPGSHATLRQARQARNSLRPVEVAPHAESVDVVVCVHNALDDVRKCLESIVARTRPPYRLIVVDDGSDSETAEFVRDFMVGQPGILIRNDAAQGYTLAANAGLRRSNADFVVLLNSDTIVTPLWLDRMVECAGSDPRIGLVGPLSNTASWQSVPKLFDANGDWAENRLDEDLSADAYANVVASASLRVYPRVGFLNGFCLLIRRGLIDSIGFFDEVRFGRGFGEENDYCLRAAKADWELAVADDAYVYHAQSRSYSHERRLSLVRDADEALREAHGEALITQCLERTKQSRILAAMRARVEVSARRLAICRSLRDRHEGRRILFVLPTGEVGGGANVVIEEARALAACGVIVGLANLAKLRSAFESSYPDLEIPTIYLESPEDLSRHVAAFDAVIATLFLSVDWILDAVRPLARQPVVGYYVQDFEPHFFDPSEPFHAQAMASYRAAQVRLITKTTWNAKEIEAYTGAKAARVGPSFAWHRFIPGERPRNPATVEVVAMVRPSTPRRAPDLTVRVLERLAKEFEGRVRLHVFGVNPAHGLLDNLRRTGQCVLHGEVTSDRISEILRDTDIFLDFSTYQAMGLTALEAMASGVAIVGPRRGGLVEVVQHEVSGLLVDTGNEGQCLRAARRLVDDWDLRDRLIVEGLQAVSGCFPEAAASALMDALFDHIEALDAR